MPKVLLISPDVLKQDTVINENVDNKKITPIILECQEMYIKPIVGSGIYNEIITQVSSSTVTADNKTLLDEYIIPCLRQYVKYEAVIELNYSFTNKAITKKESENSQTASLEELFTIRNEIKHKAEVYAERITRFLKQNYVLYPLFRSPGTGWDVTYPANTNYKTGILLDDYGFCNRCGRYPCGCHGIQWGNLTIDLIPE